MLNVDNGCRISMSGDSEVRKSAKKNNIALYVSRNKDWIKEEDWIKEDVKNFEKKYKYIDFTNEQKEYMDSSIGTFEFFLRKNPHIFMNSSLADKIADMVSCFRIECRNGYFHTHNLKDWDIVEKTRDNAIYLYFVLLGACLIPENKISNLKFLSSDRFDELCKKIREFRHFNPEFIFEYEDGGSQKLIYDSINNTIEYTDDGMEHYDSLLFYKVNEFSLEAYEQLDEGVKEEQKVYLNRANIPKKIYGIYRNGEMEELDY